MGKAMIHAAAAALLALLAGCGGGDPEDEAPQVDPPAPINCKAVPRPPACL